MNGGFCWLLNKYVIDLKTLKMSYCVSQDHEKVEAKGSWTSQSKFEF